VNVKRHRPDAGKGKLANKAAADPPTELTSERCIQVYRRCTGGKKKLVSGVHMPQGTSNSPTKFIQ
jgi:hypothetical protein